MLKQLNTSRIACRTSEFNQTAAQSKGHDVVLEDALAGTRGSNPRQVFDFDYDV